jgi:hypothetical protein
MQALRNQVVCAMIVLVLVRSAYARGLRKASLGIGVQGWCRVFGSASGCAPGAAMEGFFNALKSSGLVDVVKDMALDALHLNDDKQGSALHFTL